MVRYLAAAISVTVAAFPGTGSAQPAEDESAVLTLPCRPTIACTAEIVPGGTLEVETGYAHRRGDGVANTALGLAKYSVTDVLQLQLGTNNLVTAQTGGATQLLDGVYLGPKLVLHEQTAVTPTVAVSALAMLPTRSGPDAVTRTTDLYVWGYLSKDLLGLHADFNVGLDLLSIDSKPATQVVVALSVSRDLAHGVGAMAEGYTFEGGGSYAAHDAGLLMALSYAPAPRVMFDAGVDIALYRDARSLTAFAGVTFIPYRRAASASVSTAASALTAPARSSAGMATIQGGDGTSR